MGLSALGSLSDSIDATRDFLFSPVELRRWLAMALVVFFAGGLGGFNPIGFSNVGQQSTQQPSDSPTQDVSSSDIQEVATEIQTLVLDNVVWIVGAIALVLALGLLLRFLNALFQFVFVESLRQESVHVLGYGGANLRKAAGLFGFRLIVDLVMFAPFLVGGYLLWEPVVGGLLESGTVETSAIPGETILALVVIGALLGLLGTIVNGLTTSFVVPTMLVEDCGVLAGWGRFLSVLLGSIVEYVVYAIVAFVLRLALGTVAGIVTGIASLVVILPVGLLAAMSFLTLGLGGAGTAVLGLLVLVATLLLMALAAIVQVPFVTYVRYYSLLVLGDTEPEIDPIPDVRSRVREDSLPNSGEPA